MTTLLLSAVVGALFGSDIDSADASNTRSSFLGMDVCVGQPARSEDCDIQIFPPRPDEASESRGQAPPMSIDVLGMTVCLGPVPSDVACDLRLGPAPTQE